jgi:hypothetical protein
VIDTDSFQNTITLGNGNGDTVFGGISDTIKLGNGNDTIHMGQNETITVGKGQDVFVFDQIPVTTGNDRVSRVALAQSRSPVSTRART